LVALPAFVLCGAGFHHPEDHHGEASLGHNGHVSGYQHFETSISSKHDGLGVTSNIGWREDSSLLNWSIGACVSQLTFSSNGTAQA
jgi:hypothetical protein